MKSLFADCAAVKISLKRDALVFQGRHAGEYELSSKVDGKPSFKSGERAIWYNAENDGWIVGILANLGKFTGDIWTKDEFEGLTDGRNVWKYQNQGWKDAGPNDVDVQCIHIQGEYVPLSPPHLRGGCEAREKLRQEAPTRF